MIYFFKSIQLKKRETISTQRVSRDLRQNTNKQTYKIHEEQKNLSIKIYKLKSINRNIGFFFIIQIATEFYFILGQ